MIGRSTQRGRRTAPRLLAAATVISVVGALPAGVASAATLVDTASATVTLDAPGTLALDQFNPALGTLTSVQVSITATALVQVCIENTSAQAGATAGGTASGTLDAAFPGGAARTVATAQATGAAATLTASNGTANCTAGFDTATARFAAPVSAADVTFFQQSNQATNSATLSGEQSAVTVHRHRHRRRQLHRPERHRARAARPVAEHRRRPRAAPGNGDLYLHGARRGDTRNRQQQRPDHHDRRS